MAKKVNKNQLSLFSLDFFPDTIQNLTQLLLKVRNIKYEIEKKRNIEYLNSLDDEEFLNEMNIVNVFSNQKKVKVQKIGKEQLENWLV